MHTVDPRIGPLTPADLHLVVERHPRYWGDRDLRALHQSVFPQEFPDTCFAARADLPRPDGTVEPDAILGYLVGFVTPDGTGYIHLVATRDDARGLAVGRRLHAAFADTAARLGAVRLKAITSVTNTGSVAFHTALGFTAVTDPDHNGSGAPMVVFRRELG
jgi:GNAT superfamily N-acetyltransferase